MNLLELINLNCKLGWAFICCVELFLLNGFSCSLRESIFSSTSFESISAFKFWHLPPRKDQKRAQLTLSEHATPELLCLLRAGGRLVFVECLFQFLHFTETLYSPEMKLFLGSCVYVKDLKSCVCQTES